MSTKSRFYGIHSYMLSYRNNSCAHTHTCRLGSSRVPQLYCDCTTTFRNVPPGNFVVSYPNHIRNRSRSPFIFFSQMLLFRTFNQTSNFRPDIHWTVSLTQGSGDRSLKHFHVSSITSYPVPRRNAKMI